MSLALTAGECKVIADVLTLIETATMGLATESANFDFPIRLTSEDPVGINGYIDYHDSGTLVFVVGES